MSENVFKFVPKGGEAERISRQLVALGMGGGEAGFNFNKSHELPAATIVAMWEDLIEQHGFANVSESELEISEYDGVGLVEGAAEDQIKQALLHHFSILHSSDLSPAEQQQYWYDNPIIRVYLAKISIK